MSSQAPIMETTTETTDLFTTMLNSVLTTATELVTPAPDSAGLDSTMLHTTGSMLQHTTMAAVGTDKPVSHYLHYTMSAVIGPILCLLGMVGNILAIIIWNRPGLRGSTARYLTFQAASDFGVLLFFILCDSAQHWNPSIVNQRSYGVFFCYIGYPLFFFFIISSIWMTVGVTIDRYIMVCWIAKAKEFCNPKRANTGIVLIAINCFLINIPHYCSFQLTSNDEESNSTVAGPTFEPTDFEKGDGGKFYEFWIHCIILILIPWFSVFAMNMKIIKKIGETNEKMFEKKSSHSIKKSKRSENQVTRLLLAVTFSFLFFIGLQCVIQCIWMQQPSTADLELVSRSFAFAKTGIVFNSSLNFVFYCLMGKRFRKELAHLLCIGRSSKDLQVSSLMDTSSTGTATTSASSTSGM